MKYAKVFGSWKKYLKRRSDKKPSKSEVVLPYTCEINSRISNGIKSNNIDKELTYKMKYFKILLTKLNEISQDIDLKKTMKSNNDKKLRKYLMLSRKKTDKCEYRVPCKIDKKTVIKKNNHNWNCKSIFILNPIKKNKTKVWVNLLEIVIIENMAKIKYQTK